MAKLNNQMGYLHGEELLFPNMNVYPYVVVWSESKMNKHMVAC